MLKFASDYRAASEPAPALAPSQYWLSAGRGRIHFTDDHCLTADVTLSLKFTFWHFCINTIRFFCQFHAFNQSITILRSESILGKASSRCLSYVNNINHNRLLMSFKMYLFQLGGHKFRRPSLSSGLTTAGSYEFAIRKTS